MRIIFDLDGVLYDSLPIILRVNNRIMSKFNYPNINKSDYVKILEMSLKFLEELPEPKDRLEFSSQINEVRSMMIYSANSYNMWFNNLSILNKLTEEQFKKIRGFWIEVTKKFLEFDIKITSEVEIPTQPETQNTGGMFV